MGISYIKKTHVLQHDLSDCAPACLLSVLNYYGGSSTIDYLRTASGTSKSGTSLLGLCQAARSVGFDAVGATANDVDELISLGEPCILVVSVDNRPHFVVCYGYEHEKDLFIIGDPGRGVVNWNSTELEQAWQMHCLLLHPTDKIQESQLIVKKKKQWIKDLVKEDYNLLIFSLLFGILLSVLNLTMSVFSQKLVDVILPSRNYELLTISLFLLFVVTCANIFISSTRSRMILLQSKLFNNRAVHFFFEKLLHLPKCFFDSHKRGDLIARLGDTRRIQSVISSIFNDYIISALMLVSTTVFMFIYSWKIAVLSLLTAPICFWILFRKNRTIMNLQRDLMISYAVCESGFINTFEGMSYIKAYQKTDEFLKMNTFNYGWMQEKSYELGNAGIKIGIQSGIVNAIVQMGIIALGAFLVFNDQLTIGELMAIIGVSSAFMTAVGKLAVIIMPINEAKVAFERMFEFANSPTESVEGITQFEEEKRGLISIDGLSFRFVGRKKLFSDVSVQMNMNEITCLVGESGCGKSTICQLLERFYSPTSGEIKYNNISIFDYSLETWRSQVTYLPQEMYLLNGTIIDNICLGTYYESLESVEKFCLEYGFLDYFNELPNGLLTVVGEEGINLSGGQIQIVALARALFNPKPILILDEVTSALDRNTESFICDLLTKIKTDRIIVFVSHRLETVRKIGDKIIVLENGTISAQGDHQKLMTTDNFYSAYWRSLSSLH